MQISACPKFRYHCGERVMGPSLITKQLAHGVEIEQ